VWPPNSDGTWTAGQQDVFWKSSNSNDLWEAWWNNGWSGAQHVPVGVGRVGSAPSVATNAQRDEEDVFFKDAQTDSLYEVVFNTRTQKWYDMGVVPKVGTLG
jgi:hypothetical protein